MSNLKTTVVIILVGLAPPLAAAEAAAATTATMATMASAAVPPTSDRNAEAGSVEAVVQGLVADALAANLELEAAGATVATRLAALDQARARYLPALDFQARYTGADGGRTIEFPVGDLLNPVYATLNQLTNSLHFPSVQNQAIDFQRTREQQTDVSLTQALYDPRIAAGRAAAQADVETARAGHVALAGRIERDMRQAYYRWLQARAQVGILEATLEVSAENRRVNEALFKNGKITQDLVYRAQADELEVRQSLLGAHNGERMAKSYVNLLRDAPFDRDLPVVVVDDVDIARVRAGVEGSARAGSSEDGDRALAAATPSAPRTSSLAAPSDAELRRLQDFAVARRSELRQLDAVEAAAAAGERLARAAFKPQLALAVDAGTQGSTYGLSGDDRYVIASLVLRFRLFSGGADQAGVAGARAVEREARAQHRLAEQQVRLEVQQALEDLEVSQASLGTAAKRVEAAAAGFRIASRKRDLGQINQVEFVDARRVLTDAQQNLNVTRFGELQSLAELEFALGTGPLMEYQP
jgi:outer membrane protein TolC